MLEQARRDTHDKRDTLIATRTTHRACRVVVVVAVVVVFGVDFIANHAVPLVRCRGVSRRDMTSQVEFGLNYKWTVAKAVPGHWVSFKTGPI